MDKASPGFRSRPAPRHSTTCSGPKQVQEQPRFQEIGKQVRPLQSEERQGHKSECVSSDGLKDVEPKNAVNISQ